MEEEYSLVTLDGPLIYLSLPLIDFALLLHVMSQTQEFPGCRGGILFQPL